MAAIAMLVGWTAFVEAEDAAQRHAMATNQLQRILADMSARCLTNISSREEWQAQRPRMRRELLDMLGLDPLPARTALKATITGRLDRPEFRIEKVLFQSLPGLYVTGNLYLPNGAGQPWPTVLYLCGHSPDAQGAKVNYQNRAAWFAAHGFACFILDTLEYGEVPGIHHGTHNLNMWNWLSLGYTPAGTEVWSAMRALDYLETRPEIDRRRIGLTGISGGGAMTWFTAATDDRIAAAAPVCSTYTYGSQAEHWLASGQCDCIYYHNLYQWDFPVVAALIAPRPLLILSGQKDSIFPPDGYHEVFRRARRIYEFHSAADHIREVDDNVGHSDPPLFLREARQWMRRWLKDDPSPVPDEAEPLKERGADLACLSALPPDAINYDIQNRLTAPVTPPAPGSRSAWEKRRARLAADLRTRVFRWFPAGTVPFATQVLRRSGGWADAYGRYQDVSFQTEPGVRVRAQVFTPREMSGPLPLVICVKRPEDLLYPLDFDELLPLFGRQIVLVLNPRFTEVPITAPERTDLERTAVWAGRTIAALQTWDLLRTIAWALDEEKLPAATVILYGKDDMGIVSLYAALFDERVNQVVLSNPPRSHWQSPALLNVLRVTDIAEVAGALAPRRLVSLTGYPESFELTRKLYRLERADRALTTARSLPEAVGLRAPTAR